MMGRVWQYSEIRAECDNFWNGFMFDEGSTKKDRKCIQMLTITIEAYINKFFAEQFSNLGAKPSCVCPERISE